MSLPTDVEILAALDRLDGAVADDFSDEFSSALVSSASYPETAGFQGVPDLNSPLSRPPNAMSLNESLVEDAALVMPVASLTPTLSQKERERREAARRLNPILNANGNDSRQEAVT